MESSDLGSDNGDINDIDSEKLDASHREILEKLKRQEMEEREEIERELREAQREAIERARQHEELRAQELHAQELRGQDLRTSSAGDTPKTGSEAAVTQTEIRTQRPPGLLAQHGLTTKAHGHHHHSHNNVTGSQNAGVPLPALNNNSLEKVRSESPSPRDMRPSVLERADSRPSPPMPDMFAHHYPGLHPAFGERYLPRPGSPPTATTPNSSSESRSESVGPAGSPTGHHNWTFEEQFKQVFSHFQYFFFHHLRKLNTRIYPLLFTIVATWPVTTVDPGPWHWQGPQQLFLPSLAETLPG